MRFWHAAERQFKQTLDEAKREQLHADSPLADAAALRPNNTRWVASIVIDLQSCIKQAGT